jgi:hypothetical protein
MTDGPDDLESVQLWLCPVCTSTNETERQVCRVCRADPAKGRTAQYAEEDSPHGATLWKVIPLTASIVFAGMFFSAIAPASTPWAEAVSSHGRHVEAGSSRVLAMAMTATDLKALANELLTTSIHGDPPPTAVMSRIAYLNGRWKMYGDPDRVPSLTGPAQDLARAFDDLSSIAFLATNQPGDPHTPETVAEIITRLDRIQETLQDVH